MTADKQVIENTEASTNEAIRIDSKLHFFQSMEMTSWKMASKLTTNSVLSSDAVIPCTTSLVPNPNE